MKTSFVLLAGASTVSAGWFHKIACCGGFSDGPQTTTTVASTLGAATPTSTTTSLDINEIYPASPDYNGPTTLLTSVVPTKTADVGSVPINQDLDLESSDVESTSSDQDLNLESTDVEPVPMGQGLAEADPTTDERIATSPTEVSQSDYPESADTPSLEKVYSSLNDASITMPADEAKAIQEAENLALDAGPKELVQLIDSFQEKAFAIEEMIVSQGQATNQVTDDSEVGPESSEETIDSLVNQLADTDVKTAVFMIRFDALNTAEAPSQKEIEDDDKDMYYSFTAEDDFSIDEEPGRRVLEMTKPSSSRMDIITSDKIARLIEILRNQRMMAKQQLSISSDSEDEEDRSRFPATTETTNAGDSTESLKLGQEDSDGYSARK